MESGVREGLFNVGLGTDVTIRELAETIMDVAGFEGDIVFDSSKPDGTPRKLLSADRLNALGWKARTGLREGIEQAYADFVSKGI
jgi:GDP-L-fucose synthase